MFIWTDAYTIPTSDRWWINYPSLGKTLAFVSRDKHRNMKNHWCGKTAENLQQAYYWKDSKTSLLDWEPYMAPHLTAARHCMLHTARCSVKIRLAFSTGGQNILILPWIMCRIMKPLINFLKDPSMKNLKMFPQKPRPSRPSKNHSMHQ